MVDVAGDIVRVVAYALIIAYDVMRAVDYLCIGVGYAERRDINEDFRYCTVEVIYGLLGFGYFTEFRFRLFVAVQHFAGKL